MKTLEHAIVSKYIEAQKDNDHGKTTTQYFASLLITLGADQNYKFAWIHKGLDLDNTEDDILDLPDNSTMKSLA